MVLSPRCFIFFLFFDFLCLLSLGSLCGQELLGGLYKTYHMLDAWKVNLGSHCFILILSTTKNKEQEKIILFWLIYLFLLRECMDLSNFKILQSCQFTFLSVKDNLHCHSVHHITRKVKFFSEVVKWMLSVRLEVSFIL